MAPSPPSDGSAASIPTWVTEIVTEMPGGAVAAPTTAVTYQLWIQVARPLMIPVGSLGVCFFPAGAYCYTGSARRNLEARIARHLRQEKKLRWHVDYLLTAPGVSVVRVTRSTQPECQENQAVGGQVVVPGFGASDCGRHCGSHLRYLGACRA